MPVSRSLLPGRTSLGEAQLRIRPVARVLIVFESRYGSTARIAGRIAARLEADGHTLALRNTNQAEQQDARADAIIIAAPVYLARHPRRLRRFVRRHAALLSERPSAFVSICGALGGRWPDGPAEARRYVDHFLAATGWRPDLVLSVAGTIAYTRYGPLTRWFMRRASTWTGRSTDVTRDHELTNWSDLDRFAATFAGLLAGPATACGCGCGDGAFLRKELP